MSSIVIWQRLLHEAKTVQKDKQIIVIKNGKRYDASKLVGVLQREFSVIAGLTYMIFFYLREGFLLIKVTVVGLTGLILGPLRGTEALNISMNNVVFRNT